MTRTWWLKFLLVVFFTVLSVMYIYPTVKNLDPKTSSFPVKERITLGLDLQGGLYMVLGVDFNKVYRDVVERQAMSLSARLKEKNLGQDTAKRVEGSSVDDPRIAFQFDGAKKEEIRALIKDEFFTLRLTGEEGNRFELGLDNQYRREIREKTIDQSIEVIRNRIDEFGVAEPSINSQGTDRIVVELPGIKEVQRAKELIGRTAKLEFKIVDDRAMSPDQIMTLVTKIEQDHKIVYQEGQKFSDYAEKINQGAKGKIPANRVIAFERGPNGMRVPYLLSDRADVTGDDLQDAQVTSDPESRRPVVAFQMNPRGAVNFGKLTGDNIGNRLAIVLDNIVHSAPVIQSKISDRGQITLGSGDYDQSLKEAKDIAIVLRAGALPAQLDFLQESVVGPSLGKDSIEKGTYAAFLGCIIVFIFTAFYYRVSGVIAVASLILNVLFVVAILVGLEATLTLPGIAGIALTVGIAVDSNVVIYERIREEIRAGKSVQGSIDAGFQKAFRTILDSNVANAAAAIVLLLFGTGPVKGFAVTMLIGIITTLFTAVFFCRMMFDLYLNGLVKRKAKTMSI